MRGKKLTPKLIYQIMASWMTTNNCSETARDLDVPASTVMDVVRKNKDKPEFMKLRDEKMGEFATHAAEVIQKGMTLLNKRLTIALDKQEELDQMFDAVSDSELSEKEKQKAFHALRAMEIQDVRALTTAIATLYDKRALALGEATNNTKVTIDLPKGMSEYAD